MPLNAGQTADCAAKIAAHVFQGIVAALGGAVNTTATVNWSDLQAAVSAVDAAFDETLSQAVTDAGGATSVINFLASKIPAPVSGGTGQQKTILACYVLLKRAGLV
ncbi:MAG TPA: hypothetical protein VKI17_02800 [Gemmataceae bacterium]|nr:hypothetical protein [Gemmataceae bacterium]